MSLEKTLRRVEEDVASGDYGKARDRLHGLLRAYPGDLRLRRRLGDIYWALKHPAMAGRYWYLEDETTPEMVRARRAFERATGGDPVEILRALKFKGGLEAISGTSAERKLLALKEAAERRGVRVSFGPEGRVGYPSREATTEGFWAAVVLLALSISLLVGVGTLLVWGYRLLAGIIPALKTLPDLLAQAFANLAVPIALVGSLALAGGLFLAARRDPGTERQLRILAAITLGLNVVAQTALAWVTLPSTRPAWVPAFISILFAILMAIILAAVTLGRTWRRG